MKNQFDYKKYWIDRLNKRGDKLTGVGHKRFNDLANAYMYKRAEDVLIQALSRHGISLKNSTVLDAGSGIGIFSGFYAKRGAGVTAIDLSSEALELLKKKYSNIQTKVINLAEASSLKQKYDIVHCFDVLYHIVDDAEWKKAVAALGNLSKKYIIVHDKYPYFGYQLFEKGHVKVRSPIKMKRILGQEGFDEVLSIPTHLLYVRPLFYPLVNLFPKVMNKIDSMLAGLGLSFLQTSYIRVFKNRGL